MRQQQEKRTILANHIMHKNLGMIEISKYKSLDLRSGMRNKRKRLRLVNLKGEINKYLLFSMDWPTYQVFLHWP